MSNPTHRLIVIALGVALLSLSSPPGLTAATAAAPEIVSPGELSDTVEVGTACPTFSWTPVPGAATVELVVYALPEGVEARELPSEPILTREFPGGATSWTPSTAQCLITGQSYAWSVGARVAQESPLWSDIRVFRVSEVIERSEIEQALERVLTRFLEEKRIDEATASALLQNPEPLLEAVAVPGLTSPTFSIPSSPSNDKIGIKSDLSDGQPGLVPIYGITNGKSGTSAVRGDATDTSGSTQAFGVVGKTASGAAESAGVLGLSDNTGSGGALYGVLGVNSDSHQSSAGVGGQGSKGVLGVGNSTAGIGIVGTTEDLLADLSGAEGQTGVLGLGKNIGVRGIGDASSTDSEGVVGEGDAVGVRGKATSTTGKGASFEGGGADKGFDIELGLGKIGLKTGVDSIQFLKADGVTSATIAGDIDATKLGGESATAYLRSDETDDFTGPLPGLRILTVLDVSSGVINLPSTPASITGGGNLSGLDADTLDTADRTFFVEYGNVTGPLDMKNNIITNIGATASFTSGGGLNLTSDLSALNASFAGQVNLANGEVVTNPDGEIHLTDSGSANRLQIDLSGIEPASPLSGTIIRIDRDTPSNHQGLDLTVRAEHAVGPNSGGNLRLVGGDASGGGSDSGGDIFLDPGEPTNTGAEGIVRITSSKVVLDDGDTSNAGLVELIAKAGINDGRLFYDRDSNLWKLDNGSGTGSPIATAGAGGTGVVTNPATDDITLETGETLSNKTDHEFRIRDDDLAATFTKNFKALSIAFPEDGPPPTVDKTVVVSAADDFSSLTLPASQNGFDLRLKGGDAFSGSPNTAQPGGDLLLKGGSPNLSGAAGIVRLESPLAAGVNAITLGSGSTTVLQDGSLDLGISGNDDLTAADVATLTGGTDASSPTLLHHHDARYRTQDELEATAAASGATLIGIDSTGPFTATNVEDALIELAGGTGVTKSLQDAYVDGEEISVSSDPMEGELTITDAETGSFDSLTLNKTGNVAGGETASVLRILIDNGAGGNSDTKGTLTGIDLDYTDFPTATGTRTGIDIVMPIPEDNAISTNAKITAGLFRAGSATDNVQVSPTGALAAVGSGSITATDLTATLSTSLATTFEEESQLGTTAVSGNATGNAASTTGPDSLLLGTANNAASWASLPKCGTTNSHLTYDGDTFTCDADDTGSATPWELLTHVNPLATTFTGDHVAKTITFDFQSDFVDDRFLIKQTSGTPTGGALLDLRAAESAVTLVRAGLDDSNGILISQAGALTAQGSGSITATDLTATLSTSLATTFEEESQLGTTAVSGNATGNAASTTGPDSLLLGTANNAASWASLPKCGTTNSHLTYDGDTFTCDADDTGSATPWELLTHVNPLATTFTGDHVAKTITFDFQSDFVDDRFLIKQTSGTPTGGALLDLRAAESAVTLVRAGLDDSNGILISQAGALTAQGSGSITATDLTATLSTSLATTFEEESQLGTTAVSGNATGNAASTTGPDSLLLGTANNAASWASLPKCGTTNSHLTYDGDTFTCDADDDTTPGPDTYSLTILIPDISTGDTVWLAVPKGGTIDKICSVIDGTITTADAVLTTRIEGAAVTGGGITVLEASSVAGSVACSTPTAANTVAVGNNISIETNGASTGPVAATISVLISST